MKNIFTEHPHKVGETYFEHLYFACQFGGKMFLGGLACLTHAVFPFMFQKTGSKILFRLMQHFVKRMPEVDPSMLELSESILTKARKNS